MMVCVRCGGLRGQTGERVRHRWRTISRADKVAQALGLLERQRDIIVVDGGGRSLPRSWVGEADPSSLAELALAEKDDVVATAVGTGTRLVATRTRVAVAGHRYFQYTMTLGHIAISILHRPHRM